MVGTKALGQAFHKRRTELSGNITENHVFTVKRHEEKLL